MFTYLKKRLLAGLVFVTTIGLATPALVNAVTIVPPELKWLGRKAAGFMSGSGSGLRGAVVSAVRDHHVIQRLAFYGALGAAGYLAIDQTTKLKKDLGNAIVPGYKQLADFKEELKNDKTAFHALYAGHEHFKGNNKAERLRDIQTTMHSKNRSAALWKDKLGAYQAAVQKNEKTPFTGRFFDDVRIMIDSELADLKKMEKAVVAVHDRWDKSGMFKLDEYLSEYIKNACIQTGVRGRFEMEDISADQYDALDKAVKTAISGWNYYSLKSWNSAAGTWHNIKAVSGTVRSVVDVAVLRWAPMWWNFKGEMEFLWELKKKTYKLNAMQNAIADWELKGADQRAGNTRINIVRHENNNAIAHDGGYYPAL